MNRGILAILASAFVLSVSAANTGIAQAEVSTQSQNTSRGAPPAALDQSYRGWGYLVQRLQNDGVSETELKRVYQDRRMPVWSYIPFALRPRETQSMYAGFLNKSKIKLAQEFVARNYRVLREAEREMGVDHRVITAILLIETQFGRVTGRERVINRLSRLAAIGDPKNLLFNFRRHRQFEADVTFEQVESRARYLESTFYPEVHALLEIAKTNKVDPLEIKGSSAGAFGWPQFLPTTFLRFGRDGNNDSRVSLFVEPDAIWSTANFLNSLGWQNNSLKPDKMKVLWRYNKSEPYGETVLAIASKL